MHFCPTLPINHQPHHIDCTLPCQNPLCCLDALAILVPLLPTCAWDSLFGFFHTCMPVLVYGFVCLIPLPVHHWLLVWSLTSWVGTLIKLKQDSWTLTLSVCGLCYNSCVKYYHLNHYSFKHHCSVRWSKGWSSLHTQRIITIFTSQIKIGNKT